VESQCNFLLPWCHAAVTWLQRCESSADEGNVAENVFILLFSGNFIIHYLTWHYFSVLSRFYMITIRICGVTVQLQKHNGEVNAMFCALFWQAMFQNGYAPYMERMERGSMLHVALIITKYFVTGVLRKLTGLKSQKGRKKWDRKAMINTHRAVRAETVLQWAVNSTVYRKRLYSDLLTIRHVRLNQSLKNDCELPAAVQDQTAQYLLQRLRTDWLLWCKEDGLLARGQKRHLTAV
jgi:hypothetical protein